MLPATSVQWRTEAHTGNTSRLLHQWTKAHCTFSQASDLNVTCPLLPPAGSTERLSIWISSPALGPSELCELLDPGVPGRILGLLSAVLGSEHSVLPTNDSKQECSRGLLQQHWPLTEMIPPDPHHPCFFSSLGVTTLSDGGIFPPSHLISSYRQ